MRHLPYKYRYILLIFIRSTINMYTIPGDPVVSRTDGGRKTSWFRDVCKPYLEPTVDTKRHVFRNGRKPYIYSSMWFRLICSPVTPTQQITFRKHLPPVPKVHGRKAKTTYVLIRGYIVIRTYFIMVCIRGIHHFGVHRGSCLLCPSVLHSFPRSEWENQPERGHLSTDKKKCTLEIKMCWLGLSIPSPRCLGLYKIVGFRNKDRVPLPKQYLAPS